MTDEEKRRFAELLGSLVDHASGFWLWRDEPEPATNCIKHERGRNQVWGDLLELAGLPRSNVGFGVWSDELVLTDEPT